MKNQQEIHPLVIALDTFVGTIPNRPAVARQRTVSLLQSIPRLMRGQFLVPATFAVLAGAACLTVGLIMSLLMPVILGAGLGAVAVYLLFRTRPAVCENRLNQADEEARASIAQYTAECRRCAEEFTGSLSQKSAEVASSRVAAGGKVAEIRAEFLAIEEIARERANVVAAQLSAARESAQRADKRFRDLRANQSALSRRTAATLQRRALLRGARQVLDAMVAAHDAEIERVIIEAQLQVYAAFGDMAAAYARNPSMPPVATRVQERAPEVWRGLALPLPEEIREEAVARAEPHVRNVRQALVSGQGGGYGEIVNQIIEDEELWPSSMGEYVSGLNGELPVLAERLVKNSSQWLLATPTPGRRLHRKAFLFMADGPNSALTQALKMRLPTAGVITLDHPASETFLILEERLLTLGDIDEAAVCIAAFRAAPEQLQRDIVSAVEDSRVIVDSHADRGEVSEKARRLLAASLVLELIERSGAQEYRRGGRRLAKGYTAVVDVIRTDLRIAAELELAIAGAVSRDGSAAVVSRLKAASEAAIEHAPKEAVADFRQGVNEAVEEMERRVA